MREPEEQRRDEGAAPPGEPTAEADEFLEDDEDPGKEVHSDCRCGECCRRLIIEVGLEDAKREPKIAERCGPIYTDARLTASGKRELEGYVLNSERNGYACEFLEQSTNLCTIYETRPWACRVFDCEGESREELVQLGILPSILPKREGRGR